MVAVVAAHPMLTAALTVDPDGEPVVVAGAGNAEDILVTIAERDLRHDAPQASFDDAISDAHRRALEALAPADARLRGSRRGANCAWSTPSVAW